jgi:hypothetical protein
MPFIFINAQTITGFPPPHRRWWLSSIKFTCASEFNEKLLLPLDSLRGERIWGKKASQLPAGTLCLMFLSVTRHWAKNKKGESRFVRVYLETVQPSYYQGLEVYRDAFLLRKRFGHRRRLIFPGSDYNLSIGWIFFLFLRVAGQRLFNETAKIILCLRNWWL